MTYSLALSNKDLLVSQSRCQAIHGVDKLKQDMHTWLTEAYKVDRFNPQYGSTISSYVGQLNTKSNAFDIQIEVNRVLTNFQRYQKLLFSANQSAFSLNELLDTILDVKIEQNLDSLYLEIIFVTAASSSSIYSTSLRIQ